MIAVAYPMRALCDAGEDCKGLCSQCGRNLNREAEPSGHAGKPGCDLCEEGGNVFKIPSDSTKDAMAARVDTPWQRALRKVKPPR